MSSVYDHIITLLNHHHIHYTVMDHEPTPTSEDAARIRGTTPDQGAKALVLRSKGTFLMCVLPGNKKADFNKIRMIIGEKKLTLATPDEVKTVTGCVIGSVPPLGNLFNIPLYVDKTLLKNEKIAFNAGMLTQSILMTTEDYLAITHPTIEDFTK